MFESNHVESKITYVLDSERSSFEKYDFFNAYNSKTNSQGIRKFYKGVNYDNKIIQTITYYYENGKIKESGNHIRIYGKSNLSSREGWWKSYYESGNLKEEGFYKKNEKIGVWKLFNKKGKVIKRKKYK